MKNDDFLNPDYEPIIKTLSDAIEKLTNKILTLEYENKMMIELLIKHGILKEFGSENNPLWQPPKDKEL